MLQKNYQYDTSLYTLRIKKGKPMSLKTIEMTQPLYDYFLNVSLREPESLKALRQETYQLKEHPMIISPEQGQFMRLLMRLLQAKKTIDIGTFTGYSALSVAMALPENGKVITCDINPETSAIAKVYWKKAKADHKIDLRLAPALETLQKLLENGEAETFDFIFIDADKRNYQTYYEKCLQLLRPEGLMMVDNVLWGGKVCDHSIDDPQTEAIRAFNAAIHKDERVDISLLPIGDGVTLALKRAM